MSSNIYINFSSCHKENTHTHTHKMRRVKKLQRTLKLNKMTSFFYLLSLKKKKMLKNSLHMKQKQFNFTIVLKMSLSLASFATKAVKIQGKCKNLKPTSTPPHPSEIAQRESIIDWQLCKQRTKRSPLTGGKKFSSLQMSMSVICHHMFLLFLFLLGCLFFLIGVLRGWNSW